MVSKYSLQFFSIHLPLLSSSPHLKDRNGLYAEAQNVISLLTEEYTVLLQQAHLLFLLSILHLASSTKFCIKLWLFLWFPFLLFNTTATVSISFSLFSWLSFLFISAMFLFYLCNMPCLVLSYAMPDAIYSLYDFVPLAFTCFGGNAVVSKKIVKHFY